MSASAILTGGLGSFSSSSYLLTGGLGNFAAAEPPHKTRRLYLAGSNQLRLVCEGSGENRLSLRGSDSLRHVLEGGAR